MTLASLRVICLLQLEAWTPFEVERPANQSFYHFHTESTGFVWHYPTWPVTHIGPDCRFIGPAWSALPIADHLIYPHGSIFPGVLLAIKASLAV